MSRSEVLRHRGSYLYIRQDTLAICDNDPCAALILDLMEFWTSCRINDVRRAKEWNKNTRPDLVLAVPDYWLYEKICDFKNHIYGIYGKTKISAALAFLKEKNFIEDKPSEIPWDKTKLYRLVTESVQNALDIFWIKEDTKENEPATTTDSAEVGEDLRTVESSDLALGCSEVALRTSEVASHLYILNSQYISSLSQGEPPATAVPQTPSPTHERETENSQKPNALANQQEDIQDSPTQVISSLTSSLLQDPKVEAITPDLGNLVPPAPTENDSHFHSANSSKRNNIRGSHDEAFLNPKPETPWKTGRGPNYKWNEGFVEWHRKDMAVSDHYLNRKKRQPMTGEAKRAISKLPLEEQWLLWEAYEQWLEAQQKQEQDRQALQAALAASYEIQEQPEPEQPQSSGFSYANKLNERLKQLKAEGMPHKQAFEQAKAELKESQDATNQLAVA